MPSYRLTLTHPNSSTSYKHEVNANSESHAIYLTQDQYPGYNIKHIKEIDPIDHLLNWMDDSFGHNLTNIVVNGTIISRSVDLVFRHPTLSKITFLKGPITILIQAGFAHEYRDQNWKDISENIALGHVTSKFTPMAISHLPEAKIAVSMIMNEISNQS